MRCLYNRTQSLHNILFCARRVFLANIFVLRIGCCVEGKHQQRAVSKKKNVNKQENYVWQVSL